MAELRIDSRSALDRHCNKRRAGPRSLGFGAIGSALLGALMLAACDDAGLAERESKPAGQVVAVAGGAEITIHQVNAELRRLRVSATGIVEAQSREILEDIVDRELMALRAVAADLHRRPEVLLELQRARSLVLAHAYLRESVQPGPSPTEAQVGEFIEANPRLFEQRRMFRFDQIVLDRADFADELVAIVDQAASFDDVAALLSESGVDHVRSTVMRRAEEFDAAVLERIAAVQPGENVVIKGNSHVALMRLLASERLPVASEEAEAAARRMLILRETRDRTEDLRRTLRAEHDVQYFGHFAELNDAEPSRDAAPGSSEATRSPAGEEVTQ